MLEKTLIDLAHRHFKIMWRYEAMTNSIIIHVEKQYGQQRYQQNYRITFEEIGCSGGFELSKRMEALGYLPLPEANVEVKVDLSATPTAELVDQLSRAVQIPKHALRGGRV